MRSFNPPKKFAERFSYLKKTNAQRSSPAFLPLVRTRKKRIPEILKKSYVLHGYHTDESLILMQGGTESQIKNELLNEIGILEKHYLIIKNYLSGTEYEDMEIVGNLRVFKDTLNRISAHILTLYTLKGQRTKITWDPLLSNIDEALATMNSSSKRKPRATIQLALNISDPKIEEVMSYLAALKTSLR